MPVKIPVIQYFSFLQNQQLASHNLSSIWQQKMKINDNSNSTFLQICQMLNTFLIHSRWKTLDTEYSENAQMKHKTDKIHMLSVLLLF